MKNNVTVYDEMNRVAYEGSYASAYAWIMDHATVASDGTPIYSMWEADGYTYYNVGRQFHMWN